MDAIAQANAKVDEAKQSLDEAVFAARKDGVSWAVIGEALGVTRQATFERWHIKADQALATSNGDPS